MRSIEIPLQSEKTFHYKFFEKLPGILSWSTLLLPFVLSFISPRLTAVFLVAYLLIWFAKAVGMNVRVIQGWRTVQQHMKLDWPMMLTELEEGRVPTGRPKWHNELVANKGGKLAIKPSEVIHLVIIPTYNESADVLEPTIQKVIDSDFDKSRIILVLAYEERGGPEVEKQDEALAVKYRPFFKDTLAIKHPDGIQNEIRGKGSNATWAARAMAKYCEDLELDPMKILVTTLDSDNRPHTKYFSGVTYTYCASPDPLHTSYQPPPLFTNNIWDAPAPMRVVATGNSLWMLVTTMRPHILRNFSAHTQCLQALIDTDFWSVRTIVEDGHQFWRTYFRYDGNHRVFPIYLPIYQDAVLTSTYRSTLKAQFIQMRRWAWGASDVAYVVHTGFFKKNKVPRIDLIFKLLRLIEGHWSWAVAPLILLYAAFTPLLFHYQESFEANQLPLVVSWIQRVAMLGILSTLYLSFKILPPKTSRYKRHHSAFMVLQWALMPLTTVFYSASSGLYSQTRLMLGKYIGEFDVTDKTVVTKGGKKINSLK